MMAFQGALQQIRSLPECFNVLIDQLINLTNKVEEQRVLLKELKEKVEDVEEGKNRGSGKSEGSAADFREGKTIFKNKLHMEMIERIERLEEYMKIKRQKQNQKQSQSEHEEVPIHRDKVFKVKMDALEIFFRTKLENLEERHINLEKKYTKFIKCGCLKCLKFFNSSSLNNSKEKSPDRQRQTHKVENWKRNLSGKRKFQSSMDEMDVPRVLQASKQQQKFIYLQKKREEKSSLHLSLTSAFNQDQKN